MQKYAFMFFIIMQKYAFMFFIAECYGFPDETAFFFYLKV